MDKVTRYRETVRRVLREYVDWVLSSPSAKDVRYEVVFDPVLDHFQVVYSGWEGQRHIHGSPYHLDIIDGKIWIQYDGTDRPIANELLEAGVPREDIVLGDRSPSRRALTGFAIG